MNNKKRIPCVIILVTISFFLWGYYFVQSIKIASPEFTIYKTSVGKGTRSDKVTLYKIDEFYTLNKTNTIFKQNNISASLMTFSEVSCSPLNVSLLLFNRI